VFFAALLLEAVQQVAEYFRVEVDNGICYQPGAFVPDLYLLVAIPPEPVAVHVADCPTQLVISFSPIQGALHVVSKAGVIDVIQQVLGLQ
jgi:hypothetical protein